MCACSFTSNMALSNLTLLFFLLNIGYTEQIPVQCSNSFSSGNDTDLCYYYRKNSLTWSDAYHQCLSRTIDGILIQIFSINQFNSLKNANIDSTSIFWLGANNFASFHDSNWHWLDGSIVDNSVITWCPDSTYETAIGAHCVAYDSTLQCINNYLCNTRLPAPCVSTTSGMTKLVASGVNKLATKSVTARDITNGFCTSSYGGAYANWWTYSVLLINWFILLCFFLYLCNRFIINKSTLILTSIILILSFIMIIIFAILWGVQYQNLVQIPLAIVILACLASVLILISILIILSDRARVQRWMACMIIIFLTIIIQCFLMLGLILCIAYCSGYITLSWTNLDKDITASLLASLNAAISILFYTGVLYLLENAGQDRVHVVKPVNTNTIPLATTTQIVVPRQSQNHGHPNNHRPNPVVHVKKIEHIERATSPVDERILNEFYADLPKDRHQYTLEGRQYVVFEGKNITDIETHRKELTEAMLIQEPKGLREAIDHAKSSMHATELADDIHQAQSLASKLK